MTLELTIALIFALCFAARGQSGMLLDPTVGPQPATGFRVAVATAPITADFSFSPSSGAWPLTVQFVDLTQGGPSGWAWNFGDGGTSISQNPVHTFNSANTFTVSLTATGPGGSSATNHSITVTNSPAWIIGKGSTGTDTGAAIVTDSSGNIFASGTFSGTVNFGGTTLTSAGGFDVFVAKYDKFRNLIWATNYGGSGSETVNAITLDPGGNIYVSGSFFTSSLLKFNGSGIIQWASGAIATNGTQSVNFTSICSDSQSNIVVTGDFKATFASQMAFGPGVSIYSSFGNVSAFLAKYSTAGVGLWANGFASLGDQQHGFGVSTDTNNNILASGYAGTAIDLGGGMLTNNTSGSIFGWLAKYSSAGAYTWGRRVGTTLPGDTSAYFCRIKCLTIDSDGQPILGGEFGLRTNLGGESMDATNEIILGVSLNNDMLIVKYAGTNGAYEWSRPITCNSNGRGVMKGVACDASKNCVFGGDWYGTCSFGNTNLVAPGGTINPDGFVAKYSSTGSPVWAAQFNSVGAAANSVFMDSAGYSIFTGIFSGSANMVGQVINSAGALDIIIGRLAP